MTLRRLFVAWLVVSIAATEAAAEDDDCQTIGDLGDYELIEVGDTAYLDPAGRKKFRIVKIDEDFEEICGPRECYDAFEVYSDDAVAACSEEGYAARGVGAIYLYGDDDDAEADDAGEDTESEDEDEGSPDD